VGNFWSLVGALNDNRRNHAGALIQSGSRTIMYILGGYGELSGFIDPIFTSELGEGSPGPGAAGAPSSGHGAYGSHPTT
jgi:hypothetical protein